jgi:DNA invertase Pin-like site-specific DNA recombinase
MTTSGKFVSYLRVSTQKQGKSGLGLEAQREAVAGYLNGGRWKLVEEVVEVESGKRSDNRPKLAEALTLCRAHRATLLVAKLDRLARNVAFISALMEAGVKFVAVDMPQANDMTIHILASVAQGEAKAISDRTRAALQAAKAKGTPLGVHSWKGAGKHWEVKTVASKGNAESAIVRARKAHRFASDISNFIWQAIQAGHTSLREIAASLNQRGLTTPRGGQWTATQVKRVMEQATWSANSPEQSD